MIVALDLLKGGWIVLRKILVNIKDAKYYTNYPNNPKHDDVYIVEFPKSGITWLSTLITNVNLLESNEKVNTTFYNIHQYVPDIHTSKDLHSEPLWSFPKYRFIKSHDQYNKKYNFVIYLIRDPYRVMNSYYLFMTQLGSFNGTFEEFVKHPKYGVKAWLNHINSWLKRGATAQRIHLVKYEDLVDRPYDMIQNIYTNLGISISSENINKAISLSNVISMKKTEELNNLNNPNNDGFIFVGKGQKKFKENMNKETKEYIFQCIKHNEIYNQYYKEFNQ